MFSEEERKAFGAAMDAELNNRLKMMRKRQSYFKEIAKGYESFDEFVKAQEEKFEILGIELYDEESYISLRIQLDYNDYETYHIVMGDNGHLTVSDIIWWQDLYCANSVMNIQTGKSADEEDIPKCF